MRCLSVNSISSPRGLTLVHFRLRKPAPRLRRRGGDTSRIEIFVEFDRLAAAEAPEIDFRILGAFAGVLVDPLRRPARDHRVALRHVLVHRVMHHGPAGQKTIEVSPHLVSAVAFLCKGQRSRTASCRPPADIGSTDVHNLLDAAAAAVVPLPIGVP